jgi:hypothetical protein
VNKPSAIYTYNRILSSLKREGNAGWLTPVIPITWKAEIRGLQFKVNPGQKTSETPSQQMSQAW